MKRRDLMIGVAALALGARAAATPLARARLGSRWSVPAGAAVELWPAALGLDLAGVLDAIALWRIVPGARVSIRLDDGVHLQRAAVRLRHPDGIRLAIVGNLERPARCRLVWQGPGDGVVCGAGAVLGRIDGVQIEHAAMATRGQGSGLLAEQGGAILCGPRVTVRGFYWNCRARHGGIMRCPGVTSVGAGGAGFLAESGASIDASGALAEASLLAGFSAAGGVIRAHRAVARGNGRTGFHASGGGAILVHAAAARPGGTGTGDQYRWRQRSNRLG